MVQIGHRGRVQVHTADRRQCDVLLSELRRQPVGGQYGQWRGGLDRDHRFRFRLHAAGGRRDRLRSLRDGFFYAFNSADGSLRWKTQIGGKEVLDISSPAGSASFVYVGSGDGRVYALSKANGAVVWKSATGGEVVSSPAFANGVVYVGSNDQSIYAFDAATGAPRWSIRRRSTLRPPRSWSMVWSTSDRAMGICMRSTRLPARSSGRRALETWTRTAM